MQKNVIGQSVAAATLVLVTIVAIPTAAHALNECGDAKAYVINSTYGPYGNVGGASAACDRITIQTWANYPAFPGYRINTRDKSNPTQGVYYAAATHTTARTMTQWHASSRDNATDPIVYGNWRPPVYTPAVF